MEKKKKRADRSKSSTGQGIPPEMETSRSKAIHVGLFSCWKCGAKNYKFRDTCWMCGVKRHGYTD